LEDYLKYARERALVLKADCDKFLELIGINLDFWKAESVVIGMETEVCRLRFAIGEYTEDNRYENWHRAMEIHEIVELLHKETLEEDENGTHSIQRPRIHKSR